MNASTKPRTRTKLDALPQWARALRLRRLELGKSQEAVALDSGILNQTTVSELENDKYEIGNLTAARLGGLARGLNWSLAELEKATGVDFGLSAYASAEEVRIIPNVHIVPVRTLAAAGPAFYTDAAVVDNAVVEDQQFRRGMLVVEIVGDSMEPSVPERSRAYIDVGLTTPVDGKMYLIHIKGDGFIVKRAKKLGSSWVLASDNLAYGFLTPDEAVVVGQVYFVQPPGWKA